MSERAVDSQGRSQLNILIEENAHRVLAAEAVIANVSVAKVVEEACLEAAEEAKQRLLSVNPSELQQRHELRLKDPERFERTLAVVKELQLANDERVG